MNILVLCTGNSCRSQMAEGFLRHYGFCVQSAGLEAHGMNKHVIRVMSEVGIDISTQYSKKIDEINLKKIDILITVCDSAKESCPHILGLTNVLHKSFQDPTNHQITNPETLFMYRKVRDEIKNYIFNLIQNKIIVNE